jgi:hypothetical protein
VPDDGPLSAHFSFDAPVGSRLRPVVSQLEPLLVRPILVSLSSLLVKNDLLMKITIISLLVAILLLVLANLLVGLGVFDGSGSGSGSYEYKALNAEQMDSIGFRAVATEAGIEVSEEGEINFPKEMVDKIAKVAMLPRTIMEVENDGGWEFVAVTGDNHYLFRRVR